MTQNLSTNKSLLIVDALNIIRRVHAALPGDDGPQKNQQILLNTQQIAKKVHHLFRPTHLVWVFDEQEKTWRHECFPDYKKGRKPMPPMLKEGIQSIRDYLTKSCQAHLSIKHLEADDIIGTLAAKSISHMAVQIVSTDKSFLQLLPIGINIYHYFEQRAVDTNWVQKKFSVHPQQLTSYWAIVGDSTNGYKGVPNLGPKSAVKLLSEFSNLNDIIEALPNKALTDKDPKTFEKIASNQNQAVLCKKLATLSINLPLGVSLKSFRNPFL